MAKLTFQSAGVSIDEIDFSKPTTATPTGIPAGVIGTSTRGPAFVPVTVATFQDFISVFGNSDGKKFGPLAANEWLRNAGSLTFMRVLGAGDGKTRSASSGAVTNAGFVVGDQLVQPNGIVGRNAFNGASNPAAGAVGPLGRTYFLVALMSESNGSGIFTGPGIQRDANAAPILRGILMAPSGVVLSLSCSVGTLSNNTPSVNTLAYEQFGDAGAGNAGANIGSVVTASADARFVMLLNGLKNNDTFSNTITASFNPTSPSYFVKQFNNDPKKIEEAGHYLYAHYDIPENLAVVTGTGIANFVTPRTSAAGYFALLLTSSLSRNSGTLTDTAGNKVGIPNFEGFNDRYRTASTPWVVSQKFGGLNLDLFKFHSLTDGAAGNVETKITVRNVQASQDTSKSPYGTFDVIVRRFDDTDLQRVPLETWSGLTLDPTAQNYIARVIGDTKTYYDFDQAVGKQRVVVDGNYPNKSKYIRIEMSQGMKDGAVDGTALPVGFRGIYHLVTSGSSVNGAGSILTGSIVESGGAGAQTALISTNTMRSVTQPALPMRLSIAQGLIPNQTLPAPTLTWGVQFEYLDSVSEPNLGQKIDSSIVSACKYFPIYNLQSQASSVGDNAGLADVGGAVLDSDRFNRNFFTLENVEVITGSDNTPDSTQWPSARYRRTGIASGSVQDINGNYKGSRFLNPATDFRNSSNYLSFTFPMQGGFDGVNLFDTEKSDLTNTAAYREATVDIANQGGISGPTVASYRKAIDIMQDKTSANIQLLAIPGMREVAVTDYAITAVENNFDAMYIMDIQQRDDVNSVVTGSTQNANTTYTIIDFQGRGLDSSFAAAYFPDVDVRDPANPTTIVSCPPSVAVLGAYSLNDTFAPWFAPAGYTRGALTTVSEADVKLGQTDLDALYSARINPLTKFQGNQNLVVWGQKTLQVAQTALDRINVRRLLIEVRRRVRNVANTFIFEPNRASTLAAFSAQVNPILAAIQQGQGIDRFSVRIDTSTTTQADIENNTIRGKIFLQPTRSLEFISLDFVVNNAGAQVG
jgi:phage tail sheath protein FI